MGKTLMNEPIKYQRLSCTNVQVMPIEFQIKQVTDKLTKAQQMQTTSNCNEYLNFLIISLCFKSLKLTHTRRCLKQACMPAWPGVQSYRSWQHCPPWPWCAGGTPASEMPGLGSQRLWRL